MPIKLASKVNLVSNTHHARRQSHGSRNAQEPPFYDQHKSNRYPEGRPFCCYTEIMADGLTPPMPCTPLMPDGWESPVEPDQELADFSRTPYGRFEWRWDKMLGQDREHYETYYLAAAVLCAEKNQGNLELGDPVPFVVRALMGPPTRSPKIAEAMIAGDPWALGYTTEVNRDLWDAMRTTQDRLRMPAKGYVKPAQVLGADPATLRAMIAEAVAEAVAADRADRQAKKDAQGLKMRNGKKAKSSAVVPAP